jgi:hypothetical protein
VWLELGAQGMGATLHLRGIFGVAFRRMRRHWRLKRAGGPWESAP